MRRSSGHGRLGAGTGARPGCLGSRPAEGGAPGAISRNLGYEEVDAGFGRIAGRQKWAIPWLESDSRNGLAAVQLFAGRGRRDAADALAGHARG